MSRKAASASVVMVVLTATWVLANDHKPRAPKPPVVALRNMNGPTALTGARTTMHLKYWDLQIGTGSPATKRKAVKIHYSGWLESGRKFGSSVEAGQPVIFLLGADDVIQGWNEGIEGMKAGGKRQLWVPSYLAYGPGGSELIPAISNLIFEIEVLGVQ